MVGKIRRIDFSPDEWIVGTVGLTNDERGLYITACAMIYSHGDTIGRDDLRAACRDHGHAFNRQLARLIALGKLTENDGQISNKRCANELQKVAKRIANARKNGGKSNGRPSKNNELENPAGLQTEKLTTNYQLPTTKEEDSVGSNEPPAAPSAAPIDLAVVAGIDYVSDPDVRKLVFDVGKEILGRSSGGLIRRLIDQHAGNLRETLDTLYLAKRKEQPREYIGRIVTGEALPETDWDATYRRMGVQF